MIVTGVDIDRAKKRAWADWNFLQLMKLAALQYEYESCIYVRIPKGVPVKGGVQVTLLLAKTLSTFAVIAKWKSSLNKAIEKGRRTKCNLDVELGLL